MRRVRKKRETLTVSLFPFLAVLICTFGVLIVLLVIAVKNAEVEANTVRADASQEHEAELNRLQTQLDLQQVREDALQQMRPEVVDRLAKARNTRAYLVESFRDLEKEKRKLAFELLELAKVESSETLDSQRFAEAEEELVNQIESTRSKLSTERKAQTVSEKKTYAIVPYDGGGGTNRRPIYIECDAEGILLQPSGIRLSRSDFVEPFVIGNPLDVALITIREYWNRNRVSGETGSPYPLLVVRPDGANTYALARHAMKSWDDEFGYELVGADIDVDFGQADRQLAAEVKATVDAARMRQQRVARAQAISGARRARFENDDPRQGLIASGAQGGFVDQTGGGSRASMIGSGQSGSNGSGSDWSQQSSGQIAKTGNGQAAGPNGSRNSSRQGTANSDRAQTAMGNSAQSGDGNMSAQSAGSPASLANQRGANWALPTRTPGAIGYLRPIRIKCSATELRLVDATSNTVSIPISGRVADAITPLVDEVWKVIESWGSAGAGGYWKPELRMEVLPGGEQRCADLRSLLDGSGLQVKELAR